MVEVVSPLPRWACAAASEAGEVPTLSAYPYCPRLVAGTGGFSCAGSSENCWPSERASGAISAPSEPVALNSPANGAGIPPNDSHGVALGALSAVQRGARLRGRLGRPAAPVDVDQPSQVARAGAAVEVPGRVRSHDRASQRVAAEHDLAAQLPGVTDNPVQVADRHAHPPALGVLHGRVGDRLEVALDGRVRQVTEVVVEQRAALDLAALGQVELGLILEQVLATLDRPDLPALGRGHDPLGQRHEICASGRGARLDHEHVLGRPGPDFDHPDLVVAGRGPGGRDALDPGHAERAGGGGQ